MSLNVANFTTKIRNDLLSFLAPGGSPGLQKYQIYGVILASAEAYSDVHFLDVIESIICEHEVEDGEIMSLAKSAVAFVRSKETDKDSLNIEQNSYTRTSEKQNKDDQDFMFYALAASHVMNFDKYINIREQLVSEMHTDEETINSINRIAEYISSVEKTAVHAFKHKPKILVVDDEIRFARIVKSILSRTGKYEVKIETRGSNTINTAHEFKPDLILLDMIMPDMSGEEVAQQIREDEELSHIKIIILSAILTKAETGNAGKEIGGYLCLAKPVTDKDLLSCVEEIITQ